MNTAESESKCGCVEFPVPSGAALPEAAGGGKEFDLVCSFKMSGDKVRMTKFGDTPVGADKPAASESRPDYSEYGKSVQAGFAGEDQSAEA